MPSLFLLWRYDLATFHECKFLLVTEGKKKSFVAVNTYHGTRYFEYKKYRFCYNGSDFTMLESKLINVSFKDLQKLKQGHIMDKVYEYRARYGENRILIENVPVLKMLLKKATQMFYLFQIASVIIWMFQGYITYAIVIIVMSVVSILWEVYSAKKNEIQLRSLTDKSCKIKVLRNSRVTHINSFSLVLGDVVIVDGDLIGTGDTQIPCDLILVQGEAVVDESSLTGETVPIVKVPLPFSNTIFNIERSKANVLYGGSCLKQVKLVDGTIVNARPSAFDVPPDADTLELDQVADFDNRALAIVYSTGFSTTKGELFRSILYPNEIVFQFNRDAMNFLLILGGIALIAFIDRVISYVNAQIPFGTTILYSLDIITIAVPPALPLILTVGIGFALQRLKTKGVFCINPDRLNYAGRLDTMCWDKTGTLTAPNLKFIGTHKESGFHQNLDFSPRNILQQRFSLERFMLVCHGISKPHDEFVGHSLDIETFTRTGFNISSYHPAETAFQGRIVPIICSITETAFEKPIYIAKRFDFCSYLQTSTTISFSTVDDAFLVCTKGSPEAIKKKCLFESIPVDFDRVCKKYSMEGYYVIACAVKDLHSSTTPINELLRSDVEAGLRFIGLLLFENPLKGETYDTFEILKVANIRSIIITGDNAYTAIHVAKQLELITSVTMIDLESDALVYSRIVGAEIEDHVQIKEIGEELDQNPEMELSITGAALSYLIDSKESSVIDRIMPFIRIFARTKPDQKTWVVEWLIRNGANVGMCGDGTNDCGALKAAHVGLALSAAEASIVAPFTSSKKSVKDLVELVREGRCALETSFVGFKYMMLYPMIQLMISASLNKFGGALSNNQFLFDDLFVVTTLALFSLYTEPAVKLAPTRPTDTLFSKEIMISIVGQLLLCIFFFGLNLGIGLKQPWYCSIRTAVRFLDKSFMPIDPKKGAANYPCYEINPELDTSAFSVLKSFENAFIWPYSHFQFAIVIFCLSVAISKYRKSFLTNIYFIVYWIFIMVVMLYGLIFLSINYTESGIIDRILGFFFEIKLSVPISFKIMQLIFIAVHLVSGSLLEVFIKQRGS